MTKRIQAYFSTEDAAEGAKTALIPYGVEGIEVSALTDPLDTGGNNRRNILMPLAPYNTSATGLPEGSTQQGARQGRLQEQPLCLELLLMMIWAGQMMNERRVRFTGTLI